MNAKIELCRPRADGVNEKRGELSRSIRAGSQAMSGVTTIGEARPHADASGATRHLTVMFVVATAANVPVTRLLPYATT